MIKPFGQKLADMHNWQPPPGWRKIRTVDAHTEGEPLRVIIDGYPALPGDTILTRRSAAKQSYDHLRTALMWEPRGHADMYGCLITPPVSPEADFGVIFLHNEGYSTMCGHGIIAVTKIALETGLLEMQATLTRVVIDSPAGMVTAYARIKDGSVESVAFHNVPAYVAKLDAEIEVPGLGCIRYDLAFGGAYYAFVQAADLGLSCTPADYRGLIDAGMRIKQAIMAGETIEHPFERDLGFLYGTIFIGPAQQPGAHSRNVCIFAEGEVDRCPTGTGVSARMAIHHARGEIKPGEKVVIESIIGSRFTASVHHVTTFGKYPGVIPEVEGRAYITGMHTFVIDPGDPLRKGFILR